MEKINLLTSYVLGLIHSASRLAVTHIVRKLGWTESQVGGRRAA